MQDIRHAFDASQQHRVLFVFQAAPLRKHIVTIQTQRHMEEHIVSLGQTRFLEEHGLEYVLLALSGGRGLLVLVPQSETTTRFHLQLLQRRSRHPPKHIEHSDTTNTSGVADWVKQVAWKRLQPRLFVHKIAAFVDILGSIVVHITGEFAFSKELKHCLKSLEAAHFSMHHAMLN